MNEKNDRFDCGGIPENGINTEEAERLQVYKLWPKLPVKIRSVILSLVAFCDVEEDAR